MSLSADQKAMLEMLLERRQSYADLGDLLGLDEAEVRARARAALTELGGADPDRNVSVTDYLLGQADPIGRADAARHLGADAQDAVLADRIAGQLRDLAPGAELPKLPGAPAEGGFMRRSPGPGPAGVADRPAPSGRRRLLAVLGGGALVLIVAVLAITGAFGGDDEGTAPPTPTTPTDATGTNSDTLSPSGQEISRIRLEPQGGGDAVGLAVIALTSTSDQAYVDLVIGKLDPPPAGKAYILWFLLDQNTGYPLLPPFATDQQGAYSNRLAIPSTSLGVISRAKFISVSLSSLAEVQAKIRTAIKDNQPVIDQPGTTILLGDVPVPTGEPGSGSP